MSQADTAAIEEHDREDRRALRTLARVSVAVNTDLDLGRVLRAVVDAAVELTGASSGLLYVRSGELVPDGPAEPPAVEAEAPLTLVARSRGLERPVTRAPTLAELLPASKAQLSVDGAVAVADATAEPFTAPRALAWVAREEGARAVVAAPAVDATGLAVGVLVLLHDEVGKFGRREERFAVGLAGQAASALQRSRLFRDEARARRVAERSAARLALLQDITSALAETRDVPGVISALCSRTAGAFGASGVLIVGSSADRTRFEALGSYGIVESVVDAFASVSAGTELPFGYSVLTRETVHLPSVAERLRRFPALAAMPLQLQAHAVVPLVLHDEGIGCIAIGWAEERELPAEDRAMLEAIGRQCAQALDRAALYAAERAAREQAEATAERLVLQQDIAARLSEAVGAREVARVIVNFARSALGASAVGVLRLDEDRNRLTLIYGAPRGAAAPGVATSAEVTDDVPHAAAVRDRAPVLLRDRAEAVARFPAVPPWVLELGEALACMPLSVRGHPIGVLALHFDRRRDWTADQARFLHLLARQCAQALERATLYDRTREVAQTLQRSLLPRVPPAVPGLELAVRYRPVSRHAEVGGDFYDAFRIGSDRWGVVVGDVSGKGVEAAALTSLARYTIRAAAGRPAGPADVLRTLNAAVLDADADERFCTVAYLELSVAHGSVAGADVAGANVTGANVTGANVTGANVTGADVAVTNVTGRLALGGHPAPMLRRSDGTTTAVGACGLAIGLMPVLEVSEVCFTLAPGDLLVMVTDGILEARAPSGEFADDLVRQVLDDAEGCTAEEVATRIESAAVDFQAGRPRDDIAVVALRVPPAS